MNTLTSFILALEALAVGCSKPSTDTAPPPTKPVVHWFRNEQGLIRSDVKTNDVTSLSSPDGKQGGVHFDGDKEILDPLEEAPEFADAFRDANAQAESATRRWAGQMGRAHMFWKKKKEVLREKYQIDWKSPADLNPMTTYD